MKYNWDLIERLLQHAQDSANERFNPRKYAVQLAEEEQRAGASDINEDDLKAQACDYEALLLKADFIAPRPEAEGGNGENFVLTDRGLQLLNMIDSSFPGEQHPREILDREGLSALVPEVFDKLAVKAT
ncbi:transcriptional regulator [Pseudomonas sp. EL_65y_Pfl2_R95]|uniref:transcriptional regulator n=1 Tax=Pseudomonas sp. EL_65y_Pfl2_R95 TaxID=3088698 RepID=UPI0030DAED3A